MTSEKFPLIVKFSWASLFPFVLLLPGSLFSHRFFSPFLGWVSWHSFMLHQLARTNYEEALSQLCNLCGDSKWNQISTSQWLASVWIHVSHDRITNVSCSQSGSKRQRKELHNIPHGWAWTCDFRRPHKWWWRAATISSTTISTTKKSQKFFW